MEMMVRLGFALGIFALMCLLEFLIPRHQHPQRKHRWPVNIGLAAFNMLVMKLSIGALALISAVTAQQMQWGLFNQFEAPDWVVFIATLLIMDLAIYWQHVASHLWPWLWRLHRVHHCDNEVDVTTAVRFHPFELILSMLYKSLCIIAFGLSPIAVIVFEVILNAAATFNHSNISLPARLDNWLRWMLVTPDMHRIHHSVIREEMDSNYGFSVSWWDRLFGSYTAHPSQNYVDMAIGLHPDNPLYARFLGLLRLPFRRN